jgi:glycosyltransferase involved in cell wall biosynthesis
MSSIPQVSVVVPMRNESANVGPLATRVAAAFADSSFSPIEIILVDDGSTDDTWQQILLARRDLSNLRAVRHAASVGQSAALWTGFKASRADIIATLDGDLQNDPGDLPRLLKQLQDCDMVCGVRGKRADNFVRRASSQIARSARKLVLGVDFADAGCNLRVLRRSVLETLPAFDGIHRFMPILAHNAGAIVKEVAVAHHPRLQGKSKYGVWNRLGRGVCDLLMVRWFLKRQIGRTTGRNQTGLNRLAAEKLAPSSNIAATL